MKVLVACEYSGRVRDAFIKLGHDAVSCDLLPTDSPGPHHQGDVISLLKEREREFDMMIAFPPCTDLAVSGAAHFAAKRADGRQLCAIEFFRFFTRTCIPKVCIENPVGIMSTYYRKPNQIIQPWQFGHAESKKTCLWLSPQLPKLVPTKIVEPEYYTLPDGTVYRDKGGSRYSKTHYLSGRMQGRFKNQTPSGQNKLGPSADRAKIRSLTYQGIADAMAEQWGTLTTAMPPK